MSLVHHLIDLFLHLDVHLDALIAQFGVFTYLILFCIIFAETGLVFIPFLPGDSLLFAAGAFAARGSLDPFVLLILLTVAAIVGDTSNYFLGGLFGRTLFTPGRRFLSTENLAHAERFYETYGAKAIVFARFLPILRSLAPFVAGMAKMRYRRFFVYNVMGGIIWVLLLTSAGYFFGTIPAIARNFSLVIVGIIIISVLPAIVECVRGRIRFKKRPRL